jgi:hypothetical protein
MTKAVNVKKEPYDIFCGRPSDFGNPYKIGVHGDRDQCIDQHERDVRSNPAFIERIKRELTGKRLGCYCKPKRCHCDTYVMICDETSLIDKVF